MKSIFFLFSLSLSLLFSVQTCLATAEKPKPVVDNLASSDVAPDSSGNYAGMDEAVNEHLAEAAGQPARDPYINTEAMGDVWNMLLLLAGGVCGFVVGRYWHILWGKEMQHTKK